MTIRMTKQRAALAALLDTVTTFTSAQELHERLVATGEQVGLATVYRNLQLFAEHGLVDVVHNVDGESVYRRCAKPEHHHHLVCRRCGKTVEIAGPTVESWAELVGDGHGFVDIEHTIELFGICAGCASNSTSA